MNKRQAKQMACTHAGLIVQNALEAGWDIDSWFSNDADTDRFEEAIGEVIDGLLTRGRGRSVAPGDADISD